MRPPERGPSRIDDDTFIEMTCRIELDNRSERYVRYVVLVIAAGLFYFRYTDPRALLWGAIYLVVHLGFCWFVSRNRLALDARTNFTALVLSCAILPALLWYPLIKIIEGPVTASFASTAIVVSTFFYALARSDRAINSVVVWSGFLALLLTVLVVEIWPFIDHPIDLVGMPIAALAVLVYFVLASTTASRLRREAAEAAERSAQEQKLAAIGRLAGGVAHDFNNALTGIAGNLELHPLLEDPTEKAAVLAEAQASAHRASTLVKQLLVFSRRGGVRLQLLDAGALIQEAARFQRRLLPAHVSLHVPKAPSLVLCGDKDLLVTALINLTTNAVDAMPSGGRLTLRAEHRTVPEPLSGADGRVLPPGDYACLCVADTGGGIPPDVLPRVVEPFFTTKPVGSGSGLGLSMVAGLVQRLGGGLLIDTGPDGTCVTLMLPQESESEGGAVTGVRPQRVSA